MPVVEAPPVSESLSTLLAVPPHISRRGGDVHAWDRRLERHVWGQQHDFARSTDLVITNGKIRFRVGNLGMVPHLNVQAVREAAWQESGVIVLDTMQTPNVLMGARLLSLTPDRAAVELRQRNVGIITAIVQRGEPFIRFEFGQDRNPVSAGRRCGWLGLPPYRTVSDSTGTGKFAAGHRQLGTDDITKLLWPRDVDKSEWTLAFWWLPENASTTQDTSGLASIYDTNGDLAVYTRYDTADNKIKLTVESTTVQSSALTFSASQPIYVCIRMSETQGLTLTVDDEHMTTASPGPGTALDYDYFAFIAHGDGTWGDGTWGEGTWGGLISGRGVFDNVQIFDRYHSDARVDALAGASSPFDGIAGIEGSLRWHAPFDVQPVIPAPALSNGRLVEASAGLDGLRRFVAALGPASASGFTLLTGGPKASFAAGVLATGASAADAHARIAYANQQETRAG